LFFGAEIFNLQKKNPQKLNVFFLDQHRRYFTPQKLPVIRGISGRTNKMTEVQLPVILGIFDENQNSADMHTSIMCIKILQTIKAVALKL
jgi:hypothetical protein